MRRKIVWVLSVFLGCVELQSEREERVLKEIQEKHAAAAQQECWESKDVALVATTDEAGNIVMGKPACGMVTGLNTSQLIGALPVTHTMAVQAVILDFQRRYPGVVIKSGTATVPAK